MLAVLQGHTCHFVMEVVGGIDHDEFYLRIFQDLFVIPDNDSTGMPACGVIPVPFKNPGNSEARVRLQQRTVEHLA